VQASTAVVRPRTVSLRAHGRVAYLTPPDALHVVRSGCAMAYALYTVRPSLHAMLSALYAEHGDRWLAGRWPHRESAAVQAPARSAYPDAVDLQDDGRYLQDARQCLQDALHSRPDTGTYWYLHSGSLHVHGLATYLASIGLHRQQLSMHLNRRVM
jgi:hypothetical protein